jgi:dimeric dUTPase (all-alpha-NTP-PPase superfamily)
VNIEKLFTKQRELDTYIIQNIGMSAEDFHDTLTVDKRVFALKVELAEFANETGWFKYWKRSHRLKRKETLEELADVVHFFLSVGLSRRYTFPQMMELDPFKYVGDKQELLFTELMENPIKSSGNWKACFEMLLAIGIKLGFTLGEIETAYYAKHAENIERQKRNY